MTPSRTVTPNLTTVPASNTYTFDAGCGTYGFDWCVSTAGVSLAGNATLTLQRGATYRFVAGFSAAHKLHIKTMPTSGDQNLFYTLTEFPLLTGTSIDFTMPTDAPDELWYVCHYHPSMAGQIRATSAP
jgi:plastocyanin